MSSSQGANVACSANVTCSAKQLNVKHSLFVLIRFLLLFTDSLTFLPSVLSLIFTYCLNYRYFTFISLLLTLLFSILFHPFPQSMLREEHRLRVFENRVLRRICGPKRDEVTRGWRKLHNEELRSLYCSPSIVKVIKARRMRWSGHGGGEGCIQHFGWEA
jgi:hypothetical protein